MKRMTTPKTGSTGRAAVRRFHSLTAPDLVAVRGGDPGGTSGHTTSLIAVIIIAAVA